MFVLNHFAFSLEIFNGTKNKLNTSGMPHIRTVVSVYSVSHEQLSGSFGRLELIMILFGR